MSNKRFEIIDYTEKSIAVFGDTKSIKEILKSLGGRFNTRLSYEGEKTAGWIFPIHMRSQIEELLEMSDETTDTEITFEKGKSENHYKSDVGDLPKGIKHLCKLQGKGYIFNDVFVNALSDYNAFSMPLHKNILKILVREGYLSIFDSKDSWSKTYQQTINNICYNFGWSEPIVKYIFDSIAYGLNYLRKRPILIEDESIVKANLNSSIDTSYKIKRGVHLEFKGVEICGNPLLFVQELTSLGFVDDDYWYNNYLTMTGTFTGTPNCKLWIYFDVTDYEVYKVEVSYPKYNNRNRVIQDYKKLKDLLTEKYGAPTSDSNNDSSTFYIKKGIIKLYDLGENVEICYIDGYYEKYHGAIQNNIAQNDL